MANPQSGSNQGFTTQPSSPVTQLRALLEMTTALVRGTEETLARAASATQEHAAQREQTRGALESIAAALEQSAAAVQVLAREQTSNSESIAAVQTGSETN